MKENRGKDMPDNIQLRCPQCGEEFSFPRGKLDAERSRLVQRNQELITRLKEIKLIPPYKQTQQTRKERAWLIMESDRISKRISEIKSVQKQASEPTTGDMFSLYRERLKDIYGEEADESILKWAKQNLKAYKIFDMSAHEFYTRSGGKHIRKV